MTCVERSAALGCRMPSAPRRLTIFAPTAIDGSEMSVTSAVPRATAVMRPTSAAPSSPAACTPLTAPSTGSPTATPASEPMSTSTLAE